MEDDRESADGGYVRITWTQEHELSLLEIAESIDPGVKGTAKEEALKLKWRSAHPTLPSKGSALVQKLRRLKARGVADPDPDPEPGHDTDQGRNPPHPQ